MSYQVLARKWRPKKFQDVIGQEAITRSLQNAIKRGRLGHAYLFAGTRGIGKTSVARIFAQAIRCEALTPDGNPCGMCAACQDILQQNSMNVIEIDGASNNGVDEIRELINNVQYLPTNGDYKVYIIDEVHMLSKPAFNALLKTLEEPPKHVIFILATTEPQKLLGTVLSRCQRFDFVNASVEVLTTHILRIAQSEGIVFDSEDLVREVARLGQGSVRDTLSLLDQVLSYTSDNKVNEEVLAQSLGIVRRKVLDQITMALLIGDATLALQGCREALGENISLKLLVTSLLDSFFNLIEHLDDQNWMERHESLQVSVAQIATAELFWLYESLARETVWIFDSISPDRTFFVLVKKLALRRELLGLEEASRGEVKKKAIVPEAEPQVITETIISQLNISEPKVEPVSEKLEKKAEELGPIIPTDKSLESFLSYLEGLAPTLVASLEHGEISPQNLRDASTLTVRYPIDGQVFYDVVAEENSCRRLEKFLGDFAQHPVAVDIQLLGSDKGDVRTRAQDRAEKDAINEEDRRTEIMADPMLKMAQEMFNTKIDKIQLAKKGE